MKKYIISFALLFVMSENIISMQTFIKLYGKKKHLSVPIKRSFNNVYYNQHINESDSHTIFKINQLAIEIRKLERQLHIHNTGKSVIYDLRDEKIIEKALDGDYAIAMQQELLQKNKVLLRLYLNNLHKIKDAASIE